VQNLFPSAGAVDDSGFIQLRINAGNGRQEDNGAPAHFLPYPGKDHNGTKISGLPDEVNFLPSQLFQDGIDDAHGRGEDIPDHAYDDYDGKEMWQIADGLDTLFELSPCQFVQQNCKDDRGGEGKDQAQDVQIQRIPHNGQKIRIAHKGLKVFPSHEFASFEPLQDPEIVKGNPQPKHGPVMKQNVVNHNRKNHQIDPSVGPYLPADFLPVRFRSGGSVLHGCIGHAVSSSFL